jgi:hypothetical protein
MAGSSARMERAVVSRIKQLGLTIAVGLAVTGQIASADAATSIRMAVVTPQGTLMRGIGVVQASLLDGGHFPGQYLIKFNTNVRSCAYIATVGGATTFGVPEAEVAVTAKFPFDNSSVVVATYFSDTGAAANLGFSLLVIC